MCRCVKYELLCPSLFHPRPSYNLSKSRGYAMLFNFSPLSKEEYPGSCSMKEGAEVMGTKS